MGLEPSASEALPQTRSPQEVELGQMKKNTSSQVKKKNDEAEHLLTPSTERKLIPDDMVSKKSLQSVAPEIQIQNEIKCCESIHDSEDEAELEENEELFE
jgi:hypothetical protein